MYGDEAVPAPPRSASIFYLDINEVSAITTLATTYNQLRALRRPLWFTITEITEANERTKEGISVFRFFGVSVRRQRVGVAAVKGVWSG